MPRLPRLLAAAALLLLAPAAPAQKPPAEHAEDEKLLKDAGCAVDAPGLLEFFRKRTFGPKDQERAAALAGQLGDDRFEVRENASQELVKLGPLARPYLRDVLASTDAEVRRRARDGLETIDAGPEPALASAAARLLGARGEAGSAAVVIAYLHWTPNEAVEEDVTLALLKVVEREGKVDPALVAALGDKSAARRGAAALAVGRSGSDAQRKDVRKLLEDPQTKVRLRAAQGLLAGRDKSGVPVLVALLAKPEAAPLAEDLLARVAGDQAPKVALGESDESRRLCREAWENWWTTRGDKLSLASAEVDPLVYDAPRRATEAATRWTAAMAKGDAATVRRLTELPFLLVAREEYNAEQLDQWVKGIPNGSLTFTAPRLVDGPRYLRNAPQQEKKRVESFPARSVFAVCFTLDENRHRQPVYVVVRCKGGEAKVVGIGLGELK